MSASHNKKEEYSGSFYQKIPQNEEDLHISYTLKDKEFILRWLCKFKSPEENILL